ncbi:MAG: hypothetical protein ACM3PU_08270 [Gemmatimonadota bacterium]
MKRIALGMLLTASAAAAPTCEPTLRGAGVRTIEGQTYVVAWRASPAIQTGDFFALDVAACSRRSNAPTILRVDAQMPEHRHGMNYRPTVSSRGEGRFAVAGLLLHMPGRWELSFELRGVDGAETLRTSLPVP